MQSSCQGSARSSYSKPNHPANSANPGTTRGLKLPGLCIKGTMLKAACRQRLVCHPGRPLGLKSSRAGDVGAQQAGLGRLGCAASKIPASPESLPCTQEKDHLHQAVLSVYYRQIAQHRALTSVRRNASPAVDPPAVNEGQGGYPNRSGLNSAATVSALGCCLAYIARCHAFNYYSNANTHGHSASPASCQGVSTTRFTLATWFLAQLPCSSASSCATCNTRLPKSLFAQFQRVDGTSDAGKTLVTAS